MRSRLFSGVFRSIRRRSLIGWAMVLVVGVLATLLAAWRPWALRADWRVQNEVVVAAFGEHAYALNFARGSRARDRVWISTWRRLDSLEGGGAGVVESPPAWVPRAPFEHPERFGLRLLSGVEVFGWPFRCLYAVDGIDADGGARVHRRAAVIPLGRRPTDAMVLGYAPMWAGLIANVALFSLVAFVIVEAAGWARRARRRRRGRCDWCGYDLAGVPGGACPECGEPRRVPSPDG